jgi:hypothetical protein
MIVQLQSLANMILPILVSWCGHQSYDGRIFTQITDHGVASMVQQIVLLTSGGHITHGVVMVQMATLL